MAIEKCLGFSKPVISAVLEGERGRSKCLCLIVGEEEEVGQCFLLFSALLAH